MLHTEIRGLDGEKKALVYDNYSKLITATDTIRKMRSNMDPLTPSTSTLAPAISHIVETASGLATTLQQRTPTAPSFFNAHVGPTRETLELKKRERALVSWVLESPSRVTSLVSQGKREEAEKEWSDVEKLLDKWKNVAGVDEVRKQGKMALDG
jgi:vacuolar protein sorting-associated protein 51